MKLTKQMRTDICAALSAKAFDARIAAFKPREHEIAQAMWQVVYGEHAKTMAKLPMGFLPTSTGISIKELPDAFSALCSEFEGFNCGRVMSRYTAVRPQFGKFLRVCEKNAIAWGDAPALCEQWQAHLQALLAVMTEQKEAERNTTAVLGSVNTRAELLALWPDVEPFVPEVAPLRRLPVPIELMANLNATLGLGASAP